jgi:hypothetical protein
VSGASVGIGRLGQHFRKERLDSDRVLVWPPLVDRCLADSAAACNLVGSHGPQADFVHQFRSRAQHSGARVLAAWTTRTRTRLIRPATVDSHLPTVASASVSGQSLTSIRRRSSWRSA